MREISHTPSESSARPWAGVGSDNMSSPLSAAAGVPRQAEITVPSFANDEPERPDAPVSAPTEAAVPLEEHAEHGIPAESVLPVSNNNLPERHRKYEQIHFIGDAVLHGSGHSGPDMEEVIQQKMKALDRQEANFQDFMAEVPTRNDRYAEQLTVLTNRAITDFGEAAANIPVSILSPEHFNAAVQAGNLGLPEDSRAVANAGRILIKVTDADMELFGPDYLVSLGLHEFGHEAATNKRTVFAAEHVQDGDEQYRRIDALACAGFVTLDPDALPVASMGTFWEESTVDEYRVRSLRELGKAPQLTGWAGTTLPDGTAIGFTGPDEGTPHYSAESGRIYLPWEYNLGAAQHDNAYDFNVSVAGIGAYGLRLLDSRVPGLYEDAIGSRTSPEARERAVAKINSVQPGLFETQARLTYTANGFREGLRNIQTALGIQDGNVEHA